MSRSEFTFLIFFKEKILFLPKISLFYISLRIYTVSPKFVFIILFKNCTIQTNKNFEFDFSNSLNCSFLSNVSLLFEEKPKPSQAAQYPLSKLPFAATQVNATPAKIVMGLNNETFQEGDMISLKAVVAGNPNPQVINYTHYMTV
jgi:hypothetical protein